MSKMYQIIEALCRAHHTNVTAMCRELDIGRSTLTELKQGRTQTLSAATTSKIAGYFNVSVAYLLKAARQQMRKLNSRSSAGQTM